MIFKMGLKIQSNFLFTRDASKTKLQIKESTDKSKLYSKQIKQNKSKQRNIKCEHKKGNFLLINFLNSPKK